MPCFTNFVQRSARGMARHTRQNEVVRTLAVNHVERGEASFLRKRTRGRCNLERDEKQPSFYVPGAFKNMHRRVMHFPSVIELLIGRVAGALTTLHVTTETKYTPTEAAVINKL